MTDTPENTPENSYKINLDPGEIIAATAKILGIDTSRVPTDPEVASLFVALLICVIELQSDIGLDERAVFANYRSLVAKRAEFVQPKVLQ